MNIAKVAVRVHRIGSVFILAIVRTPTNTPLWHMLCTVHISSCNVYCSNVYNTSMYNIYLQDLSKILLLDFALNAS